MSALISAELLRLRTVRSTRYLLLAIIASPALTAVRNIVLPGPGGRLSPGDRGDSLRPVAINGATVIGCGATGIGPEADIRGVARSALCGKTAR